MHDQIRTDSSPQRAPAPGGLAPWSISKEEWDAFTASPWLSPRRTRLVYGMLGAVVIGLSVVLPTLLAVLAALPLGLSLVLVGSSATLGLVFLAVFATMFRSGRRWSTRAQALWDERGCVCPICLAPLTPYADDRDNCGHGFITEDQPFVLHYLETIAKANFEMSRQGAINAELAALRERARARAKASRLDFGGLAHSLTCAWDRWFGFSQPLWRRVLAHVAVIAAVGAAAWPIAGIYAVIFVWCAGFFLIGSRALARARGLRARGERGAAPYEVLSGVCLFLATVAPTTIAPVIGRNLPTEMLFAIGEKLPQASEDTFDVLASRPLSAQDQQRLCDAMLPFIAKWARGGGAIDRSRHALHILACLANGALPASNYPRLAQAIAFVDVAVDGRSLGPDEGIVEIAAGARPEIALAIGGRTRSVLRDGRGAVLVSSVEVDGVIAWSSSAGSDATAPRFGLADTGTAGDRSMVVRGWFAILPVATPVSAVGGIGVDGKPVLPAGSVGPWPIDRTLTLRVR